VITLDLLVSCERSMGADATKRRARFSALRRTDQGSGRFWRG
jgi:hypothetical protein